MSGAELLDELRAQCSLLDQALRQLGSRGRTYAKAEQSYRVALAKKILEERDKGTPVTIISDVCRGSAEIAALKMERDISQTVYDAAKEACNVYKIQIRVLENQIEREWRG